jgi:hypothetical protein
LEWIKNFPDDTLERIKDFPDTIPWRGWRISRIRYTGADKRLSEYDTLEWIKDFLERYLRVDKEFPGWREAYVHRWCVITMVQAHRLAITISDVSLSVSQHATTRITPCQLPIKKPQQTLPIAGVLF